ncbi:MAG: hypothetical protein IPO91_34590 [Chloroflexi bacterium]|nr:hypothetical protein [Chloroflexota bacterium]
MRQRQGRDVGAEVDERLRHWPTDTRCIVDRWGADDVVFWRHGGSSE